MRVILANEDAARLAALIRANPSADLKVEPKEPAGEGGAFLVSVSLVGVEAEVPGKARPTPEKKGSFVIEDWDGRIIAEGEPE